MTPDHIPDQKREDFLPEVKQVLQARVNADPAIKLTKSIDLVGKDPPVPLEKLMGDSVSAAQPQGGSTVICRYMVDGKFFCVRNVTLQECTATFHGAPVQSCNDPSYMV
jgi:hypothetical protein